MTDWRKAFQMTWGTSGTPFKLRGEPVGNRWGSYGEPVGNRVRFVGNRVFRGVWGLVFLYISGVKTPDRLFLFIKLKRAKQEIGRGRSAVHPSDPSVAA